MHFTGTVQLGPSITVQGKLPKGSTLKVELLAPQPGASLTELFIGSQVIDVSGRENEAEVKYDVIVKYGDLKKKAKGGCC